MKLFSSSELQQIYTKYSFELQGFILKKKQVNFKADEAEKQRMEECAKKSSMDLSTYIRACCLSGVIFEVVAKGWPEGVKPQPGQVTVGASGEIIEADDQSPAVRPVVPVGRKHGHKRFRRSG